LLPGVPRQLERRSQPRFVVVVRPQSIAADSVGNFAGAELLLSSDYSMRWSGVLVRGQDGVAVEVPDGHRAAEGADGRVAAIPPDHTAWQGLDGRMVAVPLGHMIAEGPDGRAVPLAPGTMGLADWRGRIRKV
jgi:hypothetical protein